MDSDEEEQIRQAAAGPKPRAPNRYRFKTFAQRVNEVSERNEKKSAEAPRPPPLLRFEGRRSPTACLARVLRIIAEPEDHR